MAIDLSTQDIETHSKEGFFNENETAVDASVNASGWWKLTMVDGTFTAASAATEAEDGATVNEAAQLVYNVDETTIHMYVNFNVE